MIDNIGNSLQIAILILCVIISSIRSLKGRKEWILLSFFYGGWLLGDLYWLLCLIFFRETPEISVVSDLSWYAAYIFLYMLIRQAAPPRKAISKNPLVWLGPVFTTGMAVFFIQWGEIASNVVCAALMGLLLYAVIRRLTEKDRSPSAAYLCVVIMIICLLEYALWVSSCFFNENGLLTPYYWFDFLLSVSFIFLIPATKKAVSA